MTTFKLQLAYHDIPNIQAMYNTVLDPHMPIQSHNAKEMPGAVSMSTIAGAFPTATASCQIPSHMKPSNRIQPYQNLTGSSSPPIRVAQPKQSRATGVLYRYYRIFMLTWEVPASVEQGQPAHTQILAFTPSIL